MRGRTDTDGHERARWITVEGGRTHNLRDVSVRVPKHRVTVFTGVSGSGKSSLAFDTIAAEAERLTASSYPSFVRNRLPQHPPADVDRIDGLTFTAAIDQKRFTGNARSTVATACDLSSAIRLLFSRLGVPSAGFSPAYSFNDPSGMCPRCEGLGRVEDIDLDALIDPAKSLDEGAVLFPAFAPGTYRWKRLVLSGIADPATPWHRLPGHAVDTLLHAEGLRLQAPRPGYPGHGSFDGIVPRLRNSYLRRTPSRLTADEREGLARIVRSRDCPECSGTRLNRAARESLVDGLSIADWTAMPVSALRPVLARVGDAGTAPLVAMIDGRLEALESVGLGYLGLDRQSGTLSGGEAQRVKIVRHLGSALSDVTYVLDEPSTGLHPHDVHRLLDLLAKLRDAHNTVLVVDHHRAIIGAADHIVELGPGGGDGGGRIQFEGTPGDLARTGTATGRMLRSPLPFKDRTRARSGHVTVTGASLNNLRHITLDVPLGVLTAVTGVAGSGKSTLMARELPRRHPRFTVVEQAPLHGGSRSSPATVLGLAEPLRRAFASATGLAPSWFSSNGRGACPACKGKGTITTDLAFLDDVYTPCDACGETGFNDTARGATLRGRTIADVHAMGPEEAASFLSGFDRLTDRLSRLGDVGLGYLAIGQGLDTLSGGERQRLLLAQRLADTPEASRLCLVLDEPTAGLHGDDVDRLMGLFDGLVDEGASVVLIEHDLRVVARADHVIDMGPGAGARGGTVVFQGTPAELCTAPGSVTARYLSGDGS